MVLVNHCFLQIIQGESAGLKSWISNDLLQLVSEKPFKDDISGSVIGPPEIVSNFGVFFSIHTNIDGSEMLRCVVLGENVDIQVIFAC